MRFELPGGLGRFRGQRSADATAIAGHWIQPPGVALYVEYASPVTLARVEPDVWRGAVTPLDDRYSLYVNIERGDDGTISASFRNPELNHRGRANRFRVEVAADTVSFVDPDRPERRYRAHYDADRRQLTLSWPRIPVPVVLTPRAPAEAIGYYPRPPADAPYTYQRPVARDDGWPVASPSEVAMDEDALVTLVRDFARSDPGASRTPFVHSVLIARHGKLVLEEYFFGFDATRPHDLRSGSKTFASLMVGAAMETGAQLSVDTPVLSLLGADDPVPHADDRKRRITVGHLMTHSSGLACDDNDDDSPGNEEVMQSQDREPDWYRYALNLPMMHDPGTRYAYCTAGMNLVGWVVSRATGTWLPDFFRRHVAEPLQIERYHLNLMPTGEAYAGGGVYLTPRDFLKLGQAYLDGGVWNRRRLVSEEWVAQSTAHQIDASSNSSDGYAWHRYELRVGDDVYQEYEANGNGGQFLIVVPELDLVIVFTAGYYGMYGVWRRLRDEVVPHRILSAMHVP